MAEESTDKQKEPTVKTKYEFYVPEYGVTVEAKDAQDAVEVAKKAAKQESKLNGPDIT